MASSSPLRELTDNDLLTELAETKEELFNLRFQNVTGQLDNPSHIKQAKKQVARVLTELRAREIEAAEALEAQEAAE